MKLKTIKVCKKIQIQNDLNEVQ